MIMEKQTIGSRKRIVVPGQFEDPEEPKHKRKDNSDQFKERCKKTKVSGVEVSSCQSQTHNMTSTPVKNSTPTKEPPQVPNQPLPKPIGTSAMFPAMMPGTVIPVPMTMPILTHAVFPAAASAPWQHHLHHQQQTFIMPTQLFAVTTPWMCTNAPQTSNSQHPQSIAMAQTLNQEQCQQQSGPLLLEPKRFILQSMLHSGIDEEWRIPYSHNFHPKWGFIQNSAAADSSISKIANNDIQDKPCNKTSSHKSSLDSATISPCQVDDSLVLESNFPRIKQDAAKHFGLKESEITIQDVLCGRGGVTNLHKGNIRFRELADEYRWQYATVKKSRKAQVAQEIVQKIRDQHGRFLKKESTDDMWYEIGDELAMVKAAQTLREGLAKMYRNGIIKAKMEMDDALSPQSSRNMVPKSCSPPIAEPQTNLDDDHD